MNGLSSSSSKFIIGKNTLKYYKNKTFSLNDDKKNENSKDLIEKKQQYNKEKFQKRKV